MFDILIADGTDAHRFLCQRLLLFRLLRFVVRQLHDHLRRLGVLVEALELDALLTDFADLARHRRSGLRQRLEDLGLLVGHLAVHELLAAGHALDAVLVGGPARVEAVVLVGEPFVGLGAFDHVDEALAERAQPVHEGRSALLRLLAGNGLFVDEARGVVGLIGKVFVLVRRFRGRLRDRSGFFGDRLFRDRFLRGGRFVLRVEQGQFRLFRNGFRFLLDGSAQKLFDPLDVGLVVLVEVVKVVVVVVLVNSVCLGEDFLC